MKTYKIQLKMPDSGKFEHKYVGEQCLKNIKEYLGVVPCEEVTETAEEIYTLAQFWEDFPKAREGTNHKTPDDKLKTLRADVLMHLIQKERNEATELITKEFLKKNHVYTIRHDDKPESWIYEKGIYVPHAKTFLKEFCESILTSAYTTTLFNAVYAKVEVRTFIEQDKFFINEAPNLVACKNGILDIETKQLRDFTPNMFFFNKIPIEYDVFYDCPNIEAFLYDVLADNSDFKVLQEIFGFLLLRDYKYEKAFMFTGTGRNGKGKTVELMKRFLGVDNCSNITLQQLEKDQYALGELFNKMANLSADISSQALQHTGAFKNLTGHDLVTAQRKFLPMVSFTNYAKMVFCANELPQTRDLSEAFFDRWIILDFPFKFVPEKEYNLLALKDQKNKKIQDPYKIDKITTEEELSGLLNWALVGYERLVKNKGFSYSKSTEQTKLFWTRRSNSALAFAEEHLKEEFGTFVLKRDFRQNYRDFCRANKLRSASDKVIKQTIEEHLGGSDAQRNIVVSSNQREHVWIDIAWKNPKKGQYNHKDDE